MTSFQAAGFPFAGTDITRAWWVGIKLPPLNATVLLEAQLKNAVALTTANQIACDGLTKLAERQGDLIRSAIEDCGKTASDAFVVPASLEEAAARRTDAAGQIYASTVAGLRELSDIAARANLAAVEVLNARVVEAFDDFKALIAASGSVAAGDAPRGPAVVEPANVTGQPAPAPVELQETPTDAGVQSAVVEQEPAPPAAPISTSPKKSASKSSRRRPVRP